MIVLAQVSIIQAIIISLLSLSPILFLLALLVIYSPGQEEMGLKPEDKQITQAQQQQEETALTAFRIIK